MFGKRNNNTGAGRPRRLRVLRMFVLSLLLLIGVAMIGMIGLHSLGWVARVEAVMDIVGPWLRAAQFLCIVTLWLRWRQFVRWLAARKLIHPRAVEPLMQARHRLVLVFLIIFFAVGTDPF